MIGGTSCAREEAVIRAARATHDASVRGRAADGDNGRATAPAGEDPITGDAGLTGHLAECRSCREAYDVTRWMLRLAVDTDREALDRPLPEPGQLWWKARVLERWQNESKAEAPLDVMQRVQIAGALIAALVLVVLALPDLGGSQTATGTNGPLSLLAPFGLPSLLIAGSVLVLMTTAFTLHHLLTESDD